MLCVQGTETLYSELTFSHSIYRYHHHRHPRQVTVFGFAFCKFLVFTTASHAAVRDEMVVKLYYEFLSLFIIISRFQFYVLCLLLQKVNCTANYRCCSCCTVRLMVFVL